MKLRSCYRWSAASLGLVGATVFSILFVDRPLARFMSTFGPFQHWLKNAPVGFPILVVLAAAAIVVALAHAYLGKPLSRPLVAAVIAGTALILSVMITENVLKPIFGRTLPEAYLQSGQYGFHWFSKNEQFRSFPSGHTDQAMSIFSVLWVFYPRWRWLYVVGLIALAFALLAGNWHFLSDIIAGGYVGAVAGAVTMAAWNAISARQPRST